MNTILSDCPKKAIECAVFIVNCTFLLYNSYVNVPLVYTLDKISNDSNGEYYIMNHEFDVNMTVSALYDYNMYHTYTSASGIIGSAAGALLLILFAAYMQPYYLAGGIIIILYSPVTLYLNSRRQVKLNPTFKTPLHYVMNDEGVTVSQGEDELMVPWDNMLKAISTNQSIILYTSKTSAWVFPKKDLGQRRYELIEVISTHMSPDKVRIKQ